MQYYVKKDRKQILVSIPAKMHEPWPLYQNNSGNITVDANDGTEKWEAAVEPKVSDTTQQHEKLHGSYWYLSQAPALPLWWILLAPRQGNLMHY